MEPSEDRSGLRMVPRETAEELSRRLERENRVSQARRETALEALSVPSASAPFPT